MSKSILLINDLGLYIDRSKLKRMQKER